MSEVSILQTGCNSLGLSLTEVQQQQLLSYVHLLKKWNKAFNLTALRRSEQMIREHVLDGLAVSPYIHGDHCLDVGTGAGVPGFPLAVFYPQKQFTLLDSNGKKTRFLVQAVHDIGLKNVTVVNSRVEEFANGPFDVIMSRAVGSLVDLYQLTQALQAPECDLVLLKGQYPEAEIAAASAIGLAATAEPISVPGVHAERHILIAKGGQRG